MIFTFGWSLTGFQDQGVGGNDGAGEPLYRLPVLQRHIPGADRPYRAHLLLRHDSLQSVVRQHPLYGTHHPGLHVGHAQPATACQNLLDIHSLLCNGTYMYMYLSCTGIVGVQVS